jgi:urea transport system ATP-binding protein
MMRVESALKQRPFVLAAEGVNKSFAGFQAIKELSFYMDEGELRTVIGPNGAGKTTFPGSDHWPHQTRHRPNHFRRST